MASAGVILREIHRLQRHAADLQSKIEQGPRQLQAQKNLVARQEESLRQAHEEVTKCKVKQRDLESQLKSSQQQVEKYQKQLNDVTSKKEYDAVKVEIAGAEKHVRKVEDGILEVMGQIEEKNALIPAAEKQVHKAQEELAKVEKDLQDRLARFAQEREAALKQLAEVEANLDEDLKTLYKRLVAAKGNEALAQLSGRSCTACYTEVTPQTFNDLAHGRYALCKSCGRILYFAEGQ